MKALALLLLVCLCGLMLLPCGLVKGDLGTGLVLHYPCDDLSGDVVTDTSGNDLHGAFGSGEWAVGVSGSCLNLTGANYVVVPNSALFHLSTWTITLWFKTTAGEGCYFFTTGAYGIRIIEYGSGTQQGAIFYNSSGYYDPYANVVLDCRDGNWHFLTYSFDGVNSRFGIDNLYFGVQLSPITPYWDSSWVNVGASNGGYIWSGCIDEVRVYDRCLSNTELDSLYGAPVATGVYTQPSESSFSNDFLVLWVVLIFIVVGFFMMVLPLPWLPRFVFGVLSLMVCGVSLGTTIVLQPYIQLTGLLMSVMVMLVAAVKGRS